MAWWVPAIAAGASLLGGLLGNKSSAKEARKNRDFQERMSATAHQREVADLRRAGLNPILSASKGASTPSGSTAQQKDPITPAVSTALAVKLQQAQLDNINVDTQKKVGETEEAYSRVWNNKQTEKILMNQATSTAFDAWAKNAMLETGKTSSEGYKLLFENFQKMIREMGNNSAQNIRNSFSPNQPSLKPKDKLKPKNGKGKRKHKSDLTSKSGYRKYKRKPQ